MSSDNLLTAGVSLATGAIMGAILVLFGFTGSSNPPGTADPATYAAVPAGLVCPEGWAKTQDALLPDTTKAYIACDRFPYSLTRTVDSDLLYDYGGRGLREVTDPVERARILETQ